MSSSDPAYEQILKLAPFFQGMVSCALEREKLAAPKVLYFKPDGGEERGLVCDFREKQNLLDADELMMPMVRGIVSDAKARNMTAIVQLYAKPQLQYALEFGVAAKSFLEITAEMPQPEPRQAAAVLAFPGPRRSI